MKTKWFKINKKTKIFDSIRFPQNEDEAWDKTLKKWELIIEGYIARRGIATCGLCNYFMNDRGFNPCGTCPIFDMTSELLCASTPLTENDAHEEEYMFLLLVREATREE